MTEQAHRPVAGNRETGGLGRNDQITRGHELTARRRGEPADLGHDHLRDGLDEVHQPGAGLQQPARPRQVQPGELTQIVTGAEDRPVRRQHDPQRITLGGLANAWTNSPTRPSESTLRRSGQFMVIVTNSPSRVTNRCSAAMPRTLRQFRTASEPATRGGWRGHHRKPASRTSAVTLLNDDPPGYPAAALSRFTESPRIPLIAAKASDVPTETGRRRVSHSLTTTVAAASLLGW